MRAILISLLLILLTVTPGFAAVVQEEVRVEMLSRVLETLRTHGRTLIEIVPSRYEAEMYCGGCFTDPVSGVDICADVWPCEPRFQRVTHVLVIFE
jgi:hypothetical protein